MRRSHALGIVAAVFWLLSPAVPATAQEDAPSGGGYGCKTNGNCDGPMYKDKSNLDSWWYPICSGCHAGLSAPREPVRTSVAERRAFLSDATRFWTTHGNAMDVDPEVRANRGQFSTVVPTFRMQAEFKTLMQKRPVRRTERSGRGGDR